MDLNFPDDILLTFDCRGCEIEVSISYRYYPPSGFSGEPQEHEVELGWITHPKTFNKVSTRLSKEILKYDVDRIVEFIIEREEER